MVVFCCSRHAATTGNYATRRICIINAFIGAFVLLGFAAQYIKNSEEVRSDARTVYPALAWWSMPVFALTAYVASDFLLVERHVAKIVTIAVACLTGFLYPTAYSQVHTDSHLFYILVGCLLTAAAIFAMMFNLARTDFYGLAAMVPLFALPVGFALTFLFGHAWLARSWLVLYQEHIVLLVLYAVLLVYVNLCAWFIVPEDVYKVQFPNNLALQQDPRRPDAFPAVLGGRSFVATEMQGYAQPASV